MPPLLSRVLVPYLAQSLPNQSWLRSQMANLVDDRLLLFAAYPILVEQLNKETHVCGGRS